MDKILKAKVIFGLKLIFIVGLFTLSGFMSSYIFHLSEDKLLTNSLFPGLLFTSTTVLIFVFAKTQFKIRNLLLYYLTMYVAYLAVFFLTFFSTYFSIYVGLLTAGMGSYLTFALTNKFIKKIKFDAGWVFILGGFAFAINDILLLGPFAQFIEPIYVIHGWMHTAFAGTFLFWQALIGTKLFLILQKARHLE